MGTRSPPSAARFDMVISRRYVGPKKEAGLYMFVEEGLRGSPGEELPDETEFRIGVGTRRTFQGKEDTEDDDRIRLRRTNLL